MKSNEKIYIAGHLGMVGSSVFRVLSSKGYSNIIFRSHPDLDLTNLKLVEEYFITEKPDIVFLCAAKVGGIMANNTYPAEFIYINTAIALNVIRAAWQTNVKRLIFLGSSCIYPKHCPQPIKEEYLLSGPLEPTNRPYSIAKIAGIEMCWSFNRQYGTRFLSAMPCNLYGLGDNYNLETSHVLPALIRKFHQAKSQQSKTVELFGTGKPLREFLFAGDLADALVFLAELPDDIYNPLVQNDDICPLINIGYGQDISIIDLSTLVKDIVCYTGSIVWNTNLPDGTPKKLLDISKIKSLGWSPKTDLTTGIRIVYNDFLSRHSNSI